MHELSVASAIVDTARRHAEGRAVTVVHVIVGVLRQVVPESLRFYWDVVTRDTSCAGARLELDRRQALLSCESCRAEWEPDAEGFRCPRCGGSRVEVRAGDELLVNYIEVEAPAEAAESVARGTSAPGPQREE